MGQGKSDKQQKDSAVNFMIGFVVLLFIAFILLISNHSCSAKVKDKEIGYIVTVNRYLGGRVHHYTDLQFVIKIVEYQLPNFTINLEKQFKVSDCIIIQIDHTLVYIERGWLVSNKRGKVRFKKFKNKDNGRLANIH